MSKPDVILVIDLPNLLTGSRTPFDKARELLTECVEIARRRGHVILIYVIGDLRHFLSFLDELDELIIRLGITFVHAPTLRGGQREKETVDAILKNLLSVERFMNLEPVTFLLVSDDRDFAVDIAALQNAGHCVETVSRSQYPTLIGRFSDASHVVGMHGGAMEAVYQELQTFVRAHWRRLLLGLGKAARDEDDLETLTSLDRENLSLLVLLLEIMAREETKTGGSLPIRTLIQRLMNAPEHCVADLKGNRINWLITQATRAHVLLVLEKTVSLSPNHQLAQLVRDTWLPKRREIEVQAAATANPTTTDVAEEPTLDTGDDTAVPANGDGRKRTADEVSDQELFEALRNVFGRLGDGEADYRSGRLEAALVIELRLKGRPEGGRLKMHALRRGLVQKTGAQESSFVFTPPLES